MSNDAAGLIRRGRRPLWRSYISSFPFLGLVGAALFFAASLTPSLLPRTHMTQGLLSGVAIAAGFAAGALILWLWRYLEVPEPAGRFALGLRIAITVALALLLVYVLWNSTFWQNSIRELMGLEPLLSSNPWRVLMIAVPAGWVLIELGRIVGWCIRLVAHWLDGVIPRRISLILGVAIVLFLLTTVFNGTLGPWALNAADQVHLQLDQAFEDDVPQPTDPISTGGPDSLITWKDLGRQGRRFVRIRPAQDDIAAFTGRTAMQPIRVYAGLGAAKTLEGRVELLLEELKRVGAFERSVLVVACPTGTGWLDPAAMDTLEYLHDGDTAVVGLQYSYLQSFISIFVEPDYAADSAISLFHAVYRHWTTLPKETRPKLYLHGLSLGSSGSEAAADIYYMLADPIQGAIWSGPPFSNEIWPSIMRNREPGSPAWLPRYRDGSMVRVTYQRNALPEAGTYWGPIRVVYLVYPSDPIAFFSPRMLWREPDWLRGERGPDVSAHLRWFPIITGLQVAFDMIVSTAAPIGHGHLYSPPGYIDAWVEVSQPEGWSEADIERLKQHIRM